MSSASDSILSLFVQVLMSLIYIKNKIGPRMDPCGTPVVRYVWLDFELPISVNCFLFDK